MCQVLLLTNNKIMFNWIKHDDQYLYGKVGCKTRKVTKCYIFTDGKKLWPEALLMLPLIGHLYMCLCQAKFNVKFYINDFIQLLIYGYDHQSSSPRNLCFQLGGNCHLLKTNYIELNGDVYTVYQGST